MKDDGASLCAAPRTLDVLSELCGVCRYDGAAHTVTRCERGALEDGDGKGIASVARRL